ncbi:MAG: hypothetical protein WCY10_05275 [Candidatus Omnitrophota bacterium]
MARKGFPKDQEFEEFEKLDVGQQFESGSPEGAGLPPAIQTKLEALKRGSLSALKLVLGLSFMTFVYSSTLAFISEFGNISLKFQRPLWEGLVAFVVVYFFVWEPAKVYQKGQKILEVVFKFFAPLVKVAPYVLPIYTILLFCLYPIFNFFLPYDETLAYFMFLFGFSIALHLVFGAKSLRTKQNDFLKANYIFGFTLVYIIDVLIFSLLLNLVFEKFSFVNFFNVAYKTSHEIIAAIIKQVFVLN